MNLLDAHWKIDSVDSVKSQVKVSNTSSGLQKSFFLVKLVRASINGDSLIAVCENAVWSIDIVTGNRKRNDELTMLTNQDAASDEVYIPEFLRKK